jgi:hypothetical protein
MKAFYAASGFLLLAVVAAAQSGERPPAPARTAAAPPGTLAQVMRGIHFPNANLLFDVQHVDPGAAKQAFGGADSTSTTERFSGIYAGWQVVENAAIVLAESTDLLLVPGRLCQNGRPVPVQHPEYRKAAAAMRTAGIAFMEAAKSRNRERAIAVTNDVADACAMCHEVFRDKGDANSPARCTP